MVYTVTTKHCQMSQSWKEEIDKNLDKITKYLPHVNTGLASIKLVIKRNKIRNFFDGAITLSLPKRSLHSKFHGSYAEESIKNGFTRIFKEISKYKGKHFKSHSHFYDHSSIREIS